MDTILTVLSGIVTMWLGGLEWRMKTMDNRLRVVPSRKEVHEMIDTRQEALKVMQKQIREDIRDLQSKIDELLRLQRSNGNS